MFSFAKCFFGHTYQLKKVDEAYVNECRDCGKQVILSQCQALGHRWQRTNLTHRYERVTAWDHEQWTTETQICTACNQTREMTV